MKKIVLICLAVLLTLSLSCTAFAAGHFIVSPSTTGAPTLIEGKNETTGCSVYLVITSYADRDSLPDATRAEFEEAYAMIAGKTTGTEFDQLLSQIASEIKIDAKDLAVSDFYDVSVGGCKEHKNHGEFDVTLEAEALENFVALVHYYNGSWRIVENAEIIEDGAYLNFQEDEFSPFAIIVYTGEEPITPSEDGLSLWQILLIALAIIMSLAVLTTVFWFFILPLFKDDDDDEEEEEGQNGAPSQASGT